MYLTYVPNISSINVCNIVLLGKRLPAASGFWLPVVHDSCAAGTTSLITNYPIAHGLVCYGYHHSMRYG
jgi:hypothetical protein